MKLKKALKVTNRRYMNYVAVDSSGLIFGFLNKPFLYQGFWYTKTREWVLIGNYTGKKHYTRTLRKVTYD